jgi:hypothetical protein
MCIMETTCHQVLSLFISPEGSVQLSTNYMQNLPAFKEYKISLLFIFAINRWISFPTCSEENVYMLCNELIRTGVADPAGTDLYVVFISNEEKKVIYCLFFYCWRSYFPSVGNFPSIQVPLWHQKAGHSDDGFICWDYHVICIQVKLTKLLWYLSLV